MLFTIDTHEVQPGVLCIALAGEIDMSADEKVGGAITAAVLRAGTTTVHIDLGAVTFLDSSGINVLVRGFMLAEKHGTSYRVVNARGSVRRVLDITGVVDMLSSDSA